MHGEYFRGDIVPLHEIPEIFHVSEIVLFVQTDDEKIGLGLYDREQRQRCVVYVLPVNNVPAENVTRKQHHRSYYLRVGVQSESSLKSNRNNSVLHENGEWNEKG